MSIKSAIWLISPPKHADVILEHSKITPFCRAGLNIDQERTRLKTIKIENDLSGKVTS